MLTYGMVVEGDYDSAVLTELVKKCASSEVEVIPRVCSGNPHLKKIFPSFLKLFCKEKQNGPVDKALIIKDADNENPEPLLESLKSKIKNVNYPFTVKFIVIVQELETWLLADNEAISAVVSLRSGGTVAPVYDNLESIEKPKDILQHILIMAGVTYTREVAREIAKYSDPEKIQSRCPRFAKFREAVINC